MFTVYFIIEMNQINVEDFFFTFFLASPPPSLVANLVYTLSGTSDQSSDTGVKDLLPFTLTFFFLFFISGKSMGSWR